MANEVTKREPIKLPDIRRPGQIPSLPAWAALPIESLKENWQNDPATGRSGMVMTLPANMVLGEAERRDILITAGEYDMLLEQTPAMSADYAALTLTSVTTMLKGLSSQKTDATGYEARGEAFMIALDDVPFWAVDESIRKWYCGECGDGYDYRWAPSPAELRAVAQREVHRMRGHIRRLRSLAAAVERIEYSDEHRTKMLAKLSTVFGGNAKGLRSPGKLDRP